eukprot:3793199-Ditylum_brightwellii.AAC.1
MVVLLHQNAEKYAEKLGGMLAKEEKAFLWEGMNSKAIPQPQLLIKDHRDPDEESLFKTRLIIPATNFTATFL